MYIQCLSYNRNTESACMYPFSGDHLHHIEFYKICTLSFYQKTLNKQCWKIIQ